MGCEGCLWCSFFSRVAMHGLGKILSAVMRSHKEAARPPYHVSQSLSDSWGGALIISL